MGIETVGYKTKDSRDEIHETHSRVQFFRTHKLRYFVRT